MSFLKALKKSTEEDVVITHAFLLGYDPRNKIVHAFFEGKTDESFYGTFIRRIKSPDIKIKTYVCGNKDSVYYHYEQLASKHKKHQPLLFFVDKDIEDIIPLSREDSNIIHVTEYYSVENYIVTEEAIEQVWAEIFRQSSGTVYSDQLVKLFTDALKSVHEILLDIMSWILLHRREKNRPNLDCVISNDYFRINDGLEVVRLLDLDETIKLLDEQTKVQTPDALKERIGTCKKELSSYKLKEVIRGHNEMDFFVTFIKRLKEVSAVVSKGKIKANVDINSANIIDIMGPRVAIPVSLEVFLKRHLSFEPTLQKVNVN